jgi:ankyrin repeat protein
MKTVSYIIICVLILSCTAAFAEVAIGDSMADVQRSLGNPTGQMRKGKSATWLYPNVTVIFVDGRVDSVSGRSLQPASTSPKKPAPVLKPSTTAIRRESSDGFRNPTIFRAIDNNDYEDVKRHLQAGENVNAVDDQDWPGGETPLHLAAGWASTRMVELLLDHGANIEARAIVEDELSNATPLHAAILQKKASTVRLLLDRGADINGAAEMYDKDGEIEGGGASPLHLAAATGQNTIVNLLLEKGANINAATMSVRIPADGFVAEGQTPLHAAVMENRLSTVRLLIDKGANVNARMRDGKTPTALAYVMENPSMVRVLRMHGGTQ